MTFVSFLHVPSQSLYSQNNLLKHRWSSYCSTKWVLTFLTWNRGLSPDCFSMLQGPNQFGVLLDSLLEGQPMHATSQPLYLNFWRSPVFLTPFYTIDNATDATWNALVNPTQISHLTKSLSCSIKHLYQIMKTENQKD